jgi:hypothetical protein
MDKELRRQFNKNFTPEKYQTLLDKVNTGFGKKSTFRISETPVFIPGDIRHQLKDACDTLTSYLLTDEFKKNCDSAISKIGFEVPNENLNTTFIQFDFGITIDKNGVISPKLIEMQGFPSLYCFQNLLYESYIDAYDLPRDLKPFFDGLNTESYIEYLKKIIVGESKPENVVLLEIEPEKQNTAIDFYGSHQLLGIKVLDLCDLKKDGRHLYYIENGKKIDVEKIYNRVIFDELEKRKDLVTEFDFRDEVDVEWIGHPNWFFKISKYTMPFIHHNPYIPETRFLNTISHIPNDLENYVLKPLFSFSGEGVKFNVTHQDVEQVKDPENWILQEKVHYHAGIETPNPDEPVKFEIRMMHTWEQGAPKPRLINNLIRMSKGEMIGVKYNKDKDWIGASIGLFRE